MVLFIGKKKTWAGEFRDEERVNEKASSSFFILLQSPSECLENVWSYYITQRGVNYPGHDT